MHRGRSVVIQRISSASISCCSLAHTVVCQRPARPLRSSLITLRFLQLLVCVLLVQAELEVEASSVLDLHQGRHTS